MVNRKHIPADLDTAYLHLRTSFTVASKDTMHIQLRFYDEDGEDAGDIEIRFITKKGRNIYIVYSISPCQWFYIPFQTSVPAETDKHWVIEKRGYRTKVYCNGKQVLDITASSDTCGDERWNIEWGREVSTISLSAENLIASYYIG